MAKKVCKKLSKKKVSRKAVNKWDDRETIKAIETGMPELYREYLTLVTPSEVPPEFHVFVFMNMIAALVGDKIYYREGNDVVYPHLWTLLLGESGVGRKSTAFNSEAKILAKTGKVNMLASKGSPEGFFRELVENGGVGLLRHGELGGLLGSLRKDSMGGFADELCEVYDPSGAAHKKRLVGEEFSVDHYAMTWIAATTPDSLNKCSGHDRIGCGFLPRWQIVFGAEPEQYVPRRRGKCAGFFDEFVAKLVKAWPGSWNRGKGVEYKWSDAAGEFYDAWYLKRRPRLTDGMVANFEIRILEVVKKYGVLLAFLNGRRKIELGDIELAVVFGQYFFETSKRLVQQEIYESRFDANCQRIVRGLRRMRGKANQRDLMRTTNLNKQDFEKAIETMVVKEVIYKQVDRRTGGYGYVLVEDD